MAKQRRKYAISLCDKRTGFVNIDVNEYPEGIQNIQGIKSIFFLKNTKTLLIDISPLFDFNEVKNEIIHYIEETL